MGADFDVFSGRCVYAETGQNRTSSGWTSDNKLELAERLCNERKGNNSSGATTIVCTYLLTEHVVVT